jgi:hypothetical protein
VFADRLNESLNISNREIHDKSALIALPAIAVDAANELFSIAINLDE